jgi:15-cis-phytoene synthase
MAAPEAGRAELLALYAFNLEIARAGYVVSEPLLGEIRLRWWADALGEIFEGREARRHEICMPLAQMIRERELPRAPFDAMIAARAWDCGREPFADAASVDAYLEATAGGLMWLAALWLGAKPADEAAVRDFGRAAGAAAFLRAVPRLRALGRKPEPVDDLATRALDWMARARADRKPLGFLAAALPGAGAEAVLRCAAASPELVEAGGLEPSEFRARIAMLAMALTGRW